MLSRRSSLVTALAAVASLIPVSSALAAPTAEEIMRANFLTSKVADSTSNATFHLINPDGKERLRQTASSTKLIAGTTDNRLIIVFQTPQDIAGTKTLLIEHANADDDIWIYLPAMKKVRRLISSNKRDPFVGSDFSYGDVIGHKVEEWNHRLVRTEAVGAFSCYVIESTPKNAAVASISGYSKRVSWIDQVSSVAVKTEIYDQQGTLLKRLTDENVQKVDARANKWQPMKLTAENLQTRHRTVIEFSNFKANIGVGDDVFTPRYLER